MKTSKKPKKQAVPQPIGAPTPVARLEKIETAYSTPAPETPRSEAVRKVLAECSKFLDVMLPDSREKSLAQTKLDEVRMWALNCLSVNPSPNYQSGNWDSSIYAGGTCADRPERVRLILSVWMSHDPATAPSATWTSSGPAK